MVGAKIAMFLMLLGLGGMNFLLVERLRANPATAGQPAAPLRRGRVRHRHRHLFRRRLADLGAAGGGPDAGPRHLAGDRRTQHAGMAALQQPRATTVWRCRRCRRSWTRRRPARRRRRRRRSCPVQGNCRRAMPTTSRGRNTITTGPGCSSLAVGLLALLNRAGVRWARHWPLLFLGLAVFLFFRSDPETWPLGDNRLSRELP